MYGGVYDITFGTISILCQHILNFSWPTQPLRQHKYSTEHQQKLPFLRLSTQSFCWRNIRMVHLQSVCECVWVQIGQTCLIWCRNVLQKFTLSFANLHHRLVDIYLLRHIFIPWHLQITYAGDFVCVLCMYCDLLGKGHFLIKR